MAIKHEASRSLTYHALRLFAAGENAIREVTEAKLLSSARPTRWPTTPCRSTAAPAT